MKWLWNSCVTSSTFADATLVIGQTAAITKQKEQIQILWDSELQITIFYDVVSSTKSLVCYTEIHLQGVKFLKVKKGQIKSRLWYEATVE